MAYDHDAPPTTGWVYVYGIANDENWIAQLPAQARDAILDRMTTVEVAVGEEIMRAGQPALRMYQVESGYVKLTGLHRDGGQSFITIYRTGNAFSETSMVSRRDHHHHTTIALTPCCVRQLTRHDFWELYYRHPEIPEALCRKFAGAISRQLAARELRATHRLGKQIALLFENLAVYCAESRIGDSVTLAVPITQSDIGEHLDVTRQSVQREITILKSAGILDKHAGRWIIRDVNKLARV